MFDIGLWRTSDIRDQGHVTLIQLDANSLYQELLLQAAYNEAILMVSGTSLYPYNFDCNCFQSQCHVKHHLTEHAYCFCSCRDHSALDVFLCQATVTLHQGQCHRNEHTQIRHAYVYHHAKLECHNINSV